MSFLVGGRKAALIGGVALAALGASVTTGLAATAPAAPAPRPAPAAPAVETPTQATAPMTEQEAEDAEVEALVIEVGRVQPGAVIGDIPPELQFSPRDIRAYGASTVTELLDALEPQTSSGRGGQAGGRPNILINGARISSFAEVRDLPTEAILRVDILPEEVALKYGYRADQRVVNMVLRPRFRAKTLEASLRSPWESGGGDVTQLRGNYLRIQRGNRLMIDGQVSAQTKLYESERPIAQPRIDNEYRTLIGDLDTATINAVLSRPLGGGVSGTLNASLAATQGLSLLGLDPTAPRALERRTDGLTGHLGAGAAGSLKGWRWTWTGNFDRVTNDNETERGIAGVRFNDTAHSVSTSADTQLDVSGSLFRIPAGRISTTLTGAFQTSKLDSESLRSGVRRTSDLSRDVTSGKINLDLPITRRGGFGGFVGDFSLGLNAGIDQVSDFGGLTVVGATANWAPITGLRVLGSYTRDENAPSQSQLNDPEQATPLVQAYDFTRGETVLITRVDGGNRTLQANAANTFKLGVNYTPIKDFGLTLSSNFIYSRTDNLISTFPTASSQLEAAFPNRFVRDAAGRLISIDARPVNFDKRETSELRSGFTFRKTFGGPTAAQRAEFEARRRAFQAAGGQGRGQGQNGPAPNAQGQNAQGQNAQGQNAQGQGGPGAAVPLPAGEGPPPGPPPEGGPPPGAGGPGGFAGGPGGGFGGPGGGGRGFGGGFGGPRGGGGGPPGQVVLQVGLYHTVKFQDRITIRPGVPALDLLNGASIGAGGGTSRHQLDFQSNVTRGWLGGGINARWQSGTRIEPLAGTAGQDLIFKDLTTVGLRTFIDFGAMPTLRRTPWARNARLTFAIDNLFDAKQQVRAADGTIPQTYQEDYQDPRGRTFRVALRKLF